MKQRIFINLSLLVCLCVLIYCVANLWQIHDEYQTIEENTQAIREEAVSEIDPNDPIHRPIDFTYLLSVNPDVKGWLYIPDTGIDEPVVQGNSNDTYLYTDFQGAYSRAGSLFIESQNDGTFLDDNTIIYGHNMRNGSKFHDLRYYLKEDYYTSHPLIYLYLPSGEVWVYRIFASATINAHSDLYRIDVDNVQEYYREIAQFASLYTTSSMEMRLPTLMLSTCTSGNRDDRNVVFAMCVRKENPLESK